MLWKYRYDPELEKWAMKARKVLGFSESEQIVFETLCDKISKAYDDIKIETDEKIKDSYLYFEDGKYTFIIRIGEQSFFGEVFEFTILFFYYLIHKERKRIDEVSPVYVSMDYECSYLAHAFLLPKDQYFNAVIKSSAGDGSTIDIDKMCANLWNMNKKVVYLRGKFLEYYH